MSERDVVERLNDATDGAKLRRWPEHVTLLRATTAEITGLRADLSAALLRATRAEERLTIWAEGCAMNGACYQAEIMRREEKSE